MLVRKSGSQLTIEAGPSAKDSFLFLGVGIVFVIGGLFLLAENGPQPIAWLFTGLGVLTLVSFVMQLKQTQLTYVFDRSTQQLSVSNGNPIPFSKIQVNVHEHTWRGSYGESHSAYSVILTAGSQERFILPANSQAEADNIVEQIRQHLA